MEWYEEKILSIIKRFDFGRRFALFVTTNNNLSSFKGQKSMLIGIEQDVVGYGGHHYAYAPSRTMLEEDVVARVELLLKTI
jgi:hypothetical protein